jgi:hypothetical protein
MSRPLWQILLPLFLLSFAVHRAAAAVMLSSVDPLFVAAYGLQTLAALATALGIWLGRAWVLGALALLGIAVVATALLEGLFLDVRPAPVAFSQALVAAVATGALLLVLRHEFGPKRGRL